MDLLKNLEQFSFLSGQLIDQALEELGMDTYSINLLYLIEYSQKQGIINNQINLAKLMTIDRQAMVRLLNKLEDQEFLYRKKNPNNKRENLIYLTSTGKEKAQLYGQIFDNIQNIVINDIGKDNYDLFNSLLVQFNQSLDKYTTVNK